MMATAQKVDIDKDDVVSVDGQPVFKIEGKQGMAHTSLTVTNLDGDVLAGIDDTEQKNENGTLLLSVNFTDRNQRAMFPITVGVKKVIAKKLVEMKVIENGQLTDMGVKRFCSRYPAPTMRIVSYNESSYGANQTDYSKGYGNNYGTNRDKEITTITSNRTIYPIVERNTSATTFVIGGSIRQDGKLIATYKTESLMVNNKPGTIVRFYTADGNALIAEAKFENFGEDASLLLNKNNSTVEIAIPKNQTTQNKTEEIARYLISHQYM